MSRTDAREAVTRAHHEEWARVVAAQTRRFGDLDMAEEAAAEAFATDPSPIIALNRAIAIAELDGPEVALAAVDRLEDKLSGYHAYHAARADLLRRLGRSQHSRAPTTKPSS